jgi:hypothetical protein
VIKYEGKAQLGRLRCRWEVNMTRDLKGIELRAWTEFILIRVGTSEHSNKHSGCIKCGEFLD